MISKASFENEIIMMDLDNNLHRGDLKEDEEKKFLTIIWGDGDIWFKVTDNNKNKIYFFTYIVKHSPYK